MHVNEKYLRKRDATGRYVYFPELARIQWAESAKIYFLRSQVMAWRRRMEQEAIARSAPAPAPVENGVSTYAPIRDELTRLGANPRLLRARPRVVFVELTSRCNVRCIYCPVSLPEYVGRDLEFELEQLVDVLRRCAPHEVQLNGHGETTMLAHWTSVAKRLLAEGLPLTLTTNLAKRMSDEECDVLGRLRDGRTRYEMDDGSAIEVAVRIDRASRRGATRCKARCSARATRRRPKSRCSSVWAPTRSA